MKSRGILVFLLGVVLSVHSLNLVSFNIKNFGVSKYSNQAVIDIIIDIIEEYDLILIMELVDVSQTVLPGFIVQLNSHVQDKNIEFNYTISERLGRSNNKEQYVFIYRIGSIEVIDTFQFPDIEDVFERPPYTILVQSINTNSDEVIPPFFIVASHTKPTDAVAELNYLDEVYDAARNAFSTDVGMIMGDLNADCSYVSNKNYETLDLIVNTNFTWWIDKLADTTTSNSNCAYDRIITASSLSPFVVNNSVDIVRFDHTFNLSTEQTADVSDHYPVNISLQGISMSSPESTMSTSESSSSSSASSSSQAFNSNSHSSVESASDSSHSVYVATSSLTSMQPTPTGSSASPRLSVFVLIMAVVTVIFLQHNGCSIH